MKYREIEYSVTRWVSHSGEKCEGFMCGDESLLSNVNMVRFGTSTVEEMYEKIDYYLDNIEKCIELQELERQAGEVFYETLTYKGD
jgi:hypothetical protein